MIKSYEALATCFDFNDGGLDGPYALFSIADKNMRVVVHVSADELRKIIPMGRCRLTIQIDPPNAIVAGSGESPCWADSCQQVQP